MQNASYDICMHVGATPWLANFYIEVKAWFNARNISLLLFTFSEEVADIWERAGMKDYIKIGELPNEVDEAFCLRLIDELGFDSLGAFYRTEKYVYNLSDAFCVKQACRYIHAIYSLRDCPRAKSYVTYEGDEFDHNSFRLLCRLHNGIMNYFGYSNLALRTHFHKNEKRYWETPKHDGSNNNLPEAEKEWIHQYIKNYTSAQTSLWGSPKKFDIKFEWNYFSKALKKLVRQLQKRDQDQRYNFTNTFSRYFMRLGRRQLAPLYYNNSLSFDNGELYYYFPLHVPDDSQLTQRGLPFFNQAALVETLSMYIPYPYKLIVKEHPNGRGIYQLRQLKRISKLPNVVLVPPQMNSHAIIPKVKAIIAINSSVGYEAIMYKKPVVALGRSFYWQNGVTIDINSMYELENINSLIRQFELSEDDVLRFIWRVKSNTYDVDIYNFNETNYHEKVDAFANAVYKEVYELDNV